MQHVAVYLSMPELGIVVHPVLAALNGHGGHSRRLASLHDLVLAQSPGPRLYPLVHLFLVFQATFKGGQLLAGGPAGRAHYLHQLLPLMVGEAGQGTPVIVLGRTGPVSVVGCADPPAVVVRKGRARPVSAVARRVTLSHRGTTVGLDVQKSGTVKGDAEDPLGTVDMLSLTGHVAMVNRTQSVHGPV